jgi:predicted GNAT superfamily acetyltransferase
MTLYEEYVLEREGVQSVSTEHSFMTYAIFGDTCQVKDFFVSKPHRGLSHAATLYCELTMIAKKAGCKFLTCSVCPITNGSHESMQLILDAGFRLFGADRNLVFFRKVL